MKPLPRWADVILLPAINLLLAFLVSGLVVLAIGQNPLDALNALITGAFGSGYNFGYTLYYSTNFIFTGLAVAVAAHAGLFNIGGNGQAYVAGLGVITVGRGMTAYTAESGAVAARAWLDEPRPAATVSASAPKARRGERMNVMAAWTIDDRTGRRAC